MLQDLFKQITADIDKKIAIIGVIFGITLLIYAFTTHKPSELQEMVLTMLLACSIYLLLRDTLKERKTKLFSTEMEIWEKHNIKSRLYLLNIIFFCLLSASIIIISQHIYSRPLIFLVLVTIMSGILAIEIVVNANRAYLTFILAKIFIIGILLRASVFYQFPGPVGIDPWYHINFVEQLLIQGHVPEELGKYISFPVMHIIVASLSQLTGLGVKDSYFMIGVIEIASLIFVFLIAREIFNEKIGLLSVLMLIVSSEHILWGYWIIAMTLGIALVPILTFFLFSQQRERKNLNYKLFIILILVLVTVTHTVASFAILIVLVATWIAHFIYKTLWKLENFEQHVGLTLIMLFSVMLIGYWMYASGFIGYVAESIKFAFSMDIWEGEKMYGGVVESSWNYLSMYTFGFFAILGSLYVLNIQKEEYSQIPIVITAWVVTFFVFVSFFLGRNAILFGRWPVFIEILLAIPCSLGLLAMSALSKKRVLSVLFVLVIVFTGVMVMNDNANITQVVPWAQYPRFGLMDSEIHAYQTISTHIQYSAEDNFIYGDGYYLSCFRSSKPYTKGIECPLSISILQGDEKFHGILILRREMKDNVVRIQQKGVYRDTIEFKMDESLYQSYTDGPQYAVIYDCGTVKGIKSS